MADIATLGISIDSRDARTAAGDLNKLAASSTKAQTATDALQGAARKLGSAFGGFSLALIAREVLQTADAYSSLNARLKLVTNGTAALEIAQASLFQVAQESRVGLGATADLYSSLARSTQALGVSQADVIGVTQTINRALIVSGTSAQSAAAALTQLGQGFASGVLRGEELNSILEQTPRLAQAIADGLGVSVGKLRQLGQEGRLTAESVFGALQSQAGKLNDEFAKIPTTVSQAFQKVGNSVSVLIGEIDQSIGATSGLANALSNVATALDLIRQRRAPEGSQARTNAYIIERDGLQKLVNLYESKGQLLADTSPEKQRIAEINKLIEARQRQINLESSITDSENRRRFGKFDAERQAAAAAVLDPNKNKTGRISNPYGDELKSLRERLALLGKESELDQTNARIKLGNYGKLSAGQELQLRNLAIEIDKRHEELDLLKQSEQARDAMTQSITRAAQSALAELETLQEGNTSLAEEIELIGANAEARTAIEQARIRSVRLVKEETLARLEASGVAEQQLQVLQAEIDLLRERENLVGLRGSKTESVRRLDEQDKGDEATEFGKQAARNIQDSLGDELYQVLSGDFDNIGKSFTRMLNKMAAEAAAAQLGNLILGDFGKTGNLGGILGDFIGGFSGAGKTGNNPSAYVASSGGGSFASVAGSLLSSFFGGGRADGGPVSAGRMYEVNERVPELLNVGSRQFLMMGAQGGSVSPNAGSSAPAQRSISITNNFSFQGPVNRTTEQQLAAKAGESIQRAIARAR